MEMDEAQQAREAKRRRVSKACGPCKQAHSACDRERPCKRCIGMGRAEDCVDLSSNRRRGRPKRASEQQQQQLEDLQRELLAHRQYMLAQDQERERGAAFVGVGNQLTGAPVPKVEPPYAKEYATSLREEREELRSGGGMSAQLFEEFRKLADEVREMRKEILQVRHMQNLHEAQFSLILPLLPALARHKGSPSSPYSASASSASSSSSSPQTSSCPSAPMIEQSLFPPSPEAAFLTSSSAANPTPAPAPPPSSSSSPSSFAVAAAAGTESALQTVTTSSFLSQLAASSSYTPLPLSTLLSSNSVPAYTQPQYQQQQQSPTPPRTQQQQTAATTTNSTTRSQFGEPNAPTHAQDKIALYQQDAILPPSPHKYSLDGFGVSLAARNEMLAYLPFLRKYSITSPDVPFVVSDPKKPIAACNIHERKPGDELRPRIIFANSAFCELSLYSIDELLGYSLRKFIVLEDQATWNEFRKAFFPCLTMRSFIPLSPIITMRAMSKRKDGLLLRVTTRIQIYYDEHGYARWYVLAVDDDVEVVGPSPPPVHSSAPLPPLDLERERLANGRGGEKEMNQSGW